MKIALRALCALALFACPMLQAALGQQQAGTGTPVSGVPGNRATVNAAATITTGNTFQQVLASVIGTTAPRMSLTIANNNATDSCWIFIGSGTATKATSILLLSGGSYARYWPYVPSDAIQATCASNSDTLYVDTQ